MSDSTIVLDALIVGGGFGGVYQLKRLREEGYNVKLVDMASDYAGVWFWNRYPGARVDSSIPHYEFSDPELWLQQMDNPDQRYTPDWKGIDQFRGTWIHPSYWPYEDPDMKGKKIAVIGTGSTGVQLAQELSKVASKFVLFQRSPNLALPMKQIKYSPKSIPEDRYKEVYQGRLDSFTGFDFNFTPRNTFSDDSKARLALYEYLWAHGDFHFWLATYQDMLFDEKANAEAYNFWKSKVRSRINDPRHQELLAPEKQPYSFGCKRISLESGYFEIFNQPNVSLVDVNSTPIVEVTERGIKTTEKEWEFDIVVCATGFDALTGGMLDMNITGASGLKLNDKWKTRVKTYLGMTVAGFPNMFFTYGPQAPTAFCNGPTCAESQGEFIISLMKYMSKHGCRTVEASQESEAEWGATVHDFANASLLPSTKSWYMGYSNPGKPRECLIYLGGVPTYTKTLKGCGDSGYKGFHFK
ncbi:hypothetical protein FPSE5266_06780 [Fusarium pseudograminearum]|nr:hypothetical protein FPSE5266_06780 [Fusarium pseudograminearum]